MLWGGSALLAFEHMWHGEFVPWFPFLTNMSDSASISEIFYEMATVGVIMTIFVVAFWACMVFVSSVLERKVSKLDTVKQEI